MVEIILNEIILNTAQNGKEIEIIKKKLIDKENWDFPSGPVVNTLPSRARGVGSIPGWGAKIPHALWPKNQNIKLKQYCNKFNKDFQNGHLKKKS